MAKLKDLKKRLENLEERNSNLKLESQISKKKFQKLKKKIKKIKNAKNPKKKIKKLKKKIKKIEEKVNANESAELKERLIPRKSLHLQKLDKVISKKGIAIQKPKIMLKPIQYTNGYVYLKLIIDPNKFATQKNKKKLHQRKKRIINK